MALGCRIASIDLFEELADYFALAEADEAYVIGKRGQYTPVGAYLAGDEIIKIALQHGVQMIHPGRLHATA